MMSQWQAEGGVVSTVQLYETAEVASRLFMFGHKLLKMTTDRRTQRRLASIGDGGRLVKNGDIAQKLWICQVKGPTGYNKDLVIY